MFTKISVLVPTRKRERQVRTMIESYDQMTTVPPTAELVFRIDADDREALHMFRDSPWTVIVGPRLDGYRSLPQFFEEMRAVATGDLLMTGNDDMVFQTPDWSTKVLAVANQYPDGLFNLGVSTYNADHFPFSIVSRRAVEAMGAIHHPEIFWGDVYLRDIFKAFDRAILLPDVRVDHQWMGHTPDVVFLEAQQSDGRHWSHAYWATHRRLVAAAVAKLKRAA